MDLFGKVCVCTISLSIVLQLALANGIRNDSVLYVISHVPRAHTSHGETIVCNFELWIENITTAGQDIFLVFNASHLKVLSPNDLTFTNVSWVDGYSRLEFQEVSRDVLNITVTNTGDVQVEMNTEANPKLRLGFISGTIVYVVSETASLGSKLTPFIYITYNQADTQFSSYIIGEYVFMMTPALSLSTPNPDTLDMKEESDIGVRISYETGPVDSSVVVVYMPNSVSATDPTADIYEGEPYLHGMSTSFISQSGLVDGNVPKSNLNSPTFQSFSKTSENDVVLLNLPELLVERSGNTTIQAELNFNVKVEGLDFVGNQPDRELVVGFVMDVASSGFFVVHTALLYVAQKRDVSRVPVLEGELQHVKTDDTFENPEMQIALNIWHGEESWGSAYDIEAVLYKPDFFTDLNIKRAKDLIRSSRRLLDTVDDTFVVFQLERISFAHTVKIQFSGILDLSLVNQTSSFDLILDLVYKSWRNDTDLGNMFSTSVKIPGTEDQDACECDEDKSTEASTCDCTEEYKPCNETLPEWLCSLDRVSGLGKATILHGNNGTVFKCNKDFIKRKRGSPECFAENKRDDITKWKKLTPVVSTLLGRSNLSGDIYGFSRHGDVVMMSQNGGFTWYSIPKEGFEVAANSTDFVPVISLP